MITTADRRRLDALAAELRELAELVAGGELPTKGSAADLGRRVEQELDKRRVKPRPGERAKQVRAFADTLSEQTGAKVRPEYDAAGRRRSGSGGTWRMEWGSGPTAKAMTALAAALKEQRPYAFQAVDLEELDWVRGCGERGAITALLQHLALHGLDDRVRAAARPEVNPYGGGEFNGLTRLGDDLAYRLEYPERIYAERPMRERVDALLLLWRDRRSNAAKVDLGRRLLREGWPATRAWIDELAATTEVLVAK